MALPRRFANSWARSLSFGGSCWPAACRRPPAWRRLAYTQLVLRSKKKQVDIRLANLEPNNALRPPSIVARGGRLPKQSNSTIIDGSDGPIPLSQEHFGPYVGPISLNSQDRLAYAR